MIHVRTLGGLDIRDGEDGRRRRSVLSQPKRAALLVYLLLARPGERVPRSRLLGLFWADSSEKRARNALSQALHVLRRGLGPGVIVTGPGGDVSVDRESVTCDALRFRETLDEGRLEEALALYGGPFLDGLEVTRSPGFERWRTSERRLLEERAVEAARELAERRLAEGNPVDAVHWARRAVRWVPFDETALRGLMRLLAGLDDRGGALREYEAFRARLEREFGGTPAEATRSLARELREDRPVAEAAAAVGTERTEPAPGVERDPVARTPTASRHEDRSKADPAAPDSWRVGPSSLRALAASAALAVVIAAAAFLMRGTSGDGGTTLLDERAVLAAPLVNETRDPSLDPLGWIAADWIAQGLMETEIVRAVPGFEVAADARLLESEGRDPAATRFALDLARRAGAGLVVAGSVHRSGDSLYFRSRLLDASTGATLRALPEVPASSSAPLDGVARLRRRVVGALATAVDRNLASWSERASAPPSYEAYEAYAAGFEHFVRLEFDEAASSFMAASQHSPAFVTPRLWAFWAYRNAGSHERADSLVRRLAARREALGVFDRALLDYAIAAADYDWETAYQRSAALLDLAPGSEWRYKRGVSALLAGRREEGIAILAALGEGTGWLRAWGAHVRFLATAYHWAGLHELEHATAVRIREDGEARGRFHVARALAAMGRLGELRLMVERILEEGRRPDAGPSLAALSQSSRLADELEAHGHRTRADSLRRLVASTVDLEADGSRFSRAFRSGLLLYAGEVDSAIAGLEGLRGGPPPFRVAVRSLRGQALAASGDTAAARMELRALDALPPAERGPDRLHTYYRAGLAAALGERERALGLLEESRGDLTAWRTSGAMGWHMTVHADPSFRSLREDPSFEALVAATRETTAP